MFGACSVARSSASGTRCGMETCQSPRKVIVLAWRVGRSCLPPYASKYSRKDFTLPQLFACLTLRQFYNLSYRKTEALLRDSPSWRRAIGLKRTPDHNTLSDAFDVVVQSEHLGRALDRLADAFAEAGLLQLDRKPLAIDSTCYESRHVSRHFERRRGGTASATRS